MDKVGDLLYITDQWNGISILDVSDPRHPSLVGVYQSRMPTDPFGNGGNWGVQLRDGLAYLAAGFSGIDVVDVSDPANPFRAGGLEFPPGINSVGIELDASIAHVGTTVGGTSGFLVNFDISNPQNILDVGSLEVFAPPLTIDTSPGGIAHIARGLQVHGLATTIVDTSDPRAPFRRYDGLPAAADLALDGDLLYVADSSREATEGGFYILDVGDPTSPVQLSHFPTRFATAVRVQNRRAYLAAGDPQNGFLPTLFVFDVSEPTAPMLLAQSVDAPEMAVGVLADGRYAYVTHRSPAGFTTGLMIAEFDCGLRGDLTGDGVVDLADLGVLLADFGCQAPGPCPGDIDGDGDTDLADLGILLSNFGQSCP